MARILTTAMSAVTIALLGIVSLSYAQDDLAGAGLQNKSLEAFNVTTAVSTDLTTTMGNALPRLFVAVLLVLMIVLLLLVR